jgi:hypothetical protein
MFHDCTPSRRAAASTGSRASACARLVALAKEWKLNIASKYSRLLTKTVSWPTDDLYRPQVYLNRKLAVGFGALATY